MIAFIVAGAVTLALPALFLHDAEAAFPLRGYLTGVVASVLNGGIAYATNRAAIGKELNTFLLRCLLGHGARLALIAGFVTGATLNDFPQLRAVLVTLSIGYFTFLLSEIAMLHMRLYSARSIFPKTES